MAITFVLLAATFTAIAIQWEPIFAFPWQQWLRERTTM